MVNASLTVDGKNVGPGSIWVHMQGTEGKRTSIYSAVIPKPHHTDVFDPRGSKGSEVSWSDFILKQVEELGTFILGGYFENMAKLDCESLGKCGWVIATLDEVVESDDAIELRGTAVAFDQSKYGDRMPRFTIRNLLQATFLACLWGTVLINIKQLMNSDSVWMLLVLIPMWLFVFAGPFMIIGCAIGRTYGGFKIGLCVASAILILMFALAFAIVSS